MNSNEGDMNKDDKEYIKGANFRREMGRDNVWGMDININEQHGRINTI